MSVDFRDPRTQKSVLGGLGVCALLFVYFFTDMLPFTYKANASQVNVLEEKYRDMSKDLNKARQATHRLPYLEKEYELLHRKWEQSRSLLPENQDMAWLLRTITLLGTQAGVQFTLFKPMSLKPAQYHTENPIQITVVGGYHQIGTFLAEIANLDRIINVSELEITATKDGNPTRPAEASFVAATYTLGGTGVPPEDPGQQDGGGKAGARKGAKGSAGRTAGRGGSHE